MSAKPNGGDAFPGRNGMSLRDYFAAQALVLMQAEFLDAVQIVCRQSSIEAAAGIAAMVYSIADAMLSERAK
jgi:hypothetical protein